MRIRTPKTEKTKEVKKENSKQVKQPDQEAIEVKTVETVDKVIESEVEQDKVEELNIIENESLEEINQKLFEASVEQDFYDQKISEEVYDFYMNYQPITLEDLENGNGN